MPYYISKENPDCGGWAVEDEAGDVLGCHTTKQDAIDQMVAVSIAEDMEPGGERKTMNDKIEFRTLEAETLELREADSGDGMSFTGYAAKYDSPSLPLPFTERIAPGAFDKTLRSRNDIRMYMNHDDRMVLGSTRAKTLRLESDSVGLLAHATIPDTTYGRDLSVLIKRKDISTMSFGFSTVRDEWNTDGSERMLTEVRLHEVSVVSGVAAYPSTTASVRSIQRIARRTETDPGALDEALAALLDSEEGLTDEQTDLLLTVVARANGSKEPEPATPTVPLSLLSKKLDLIAKHLAI